MTGIIKEVFLCGSTLFVQVVAANDEIAWYSIAWSDAQNEGIPGVIQAIESAGANFAQPISPWCQQLINEVVTFN